MVETQVITATTEPSPMSAIEDELAVIAVAERTLKFAEDQLDELRDAQDIVATARAAIRSALHEAYKVIDKK